LKEISVLFGGKAGDGIKEAGHTIARLLNRLGYHIFLYDEYPSLVKGGHNFNVIRGTDKKIRTHKKNLDIIVALNQETVEKHKDDLKSGGVILYDSDKADADIDVLQPCISFFDNNDYYKEHTYELADEKHDPSNLSAAMERAGEWRYGQGDRIPIGIFYQVRKPSFEKRLLGSKIIVKTKPKDIGPVLAKQ